MFVSPKKPKGTEVEDRSSYDNMILREHRVDDCEQRFIAECLYILHQKWQIYLRDMKALIQVLSEFCSIHFRTMHPTHCPLHSADMHYEVRKSNKLQHVLRFTALAHK